MKNEFRRHLNRCYVFFGKNVNEEGKLVYLAVDNIFYRTCKIVLLME